MQALTAKKWFLFPENFFEKQTFSRLPCLKYGLH